MSDFINSIIDPGDYLEKQIIDLEDKRDELMSDVELINFQLNNGFDTDDSEWVHRARFAKIKKHQQIREVNRAINKIKRTDIKSKQKDKKEIKKKNIKASEKKRQDAIKAKQERIKLNNSEDRLFILALKELITEEVGGDKCLEMLKKAGETARTSLK